MKIGRYPSELPSIHTSKDFIISCKQSKVFYGQEPPSGEYLLPQNVGSINLLKKPNGELLVAVDHNQQRTMASETVDPIDWPHTPPSWAVPTELHVLHAVIASYKSQDLPLQPGLELASLGMPDQRTACALGKIALI